MVCYQHYSSICLKPINHFIHTLLAFVTIFVNLLLTQPKELTRSDFPVSMNGIPLQQI